MIYHGSPIPNLKEIEPNESTQKGSYVYGTPNIVYAAIFSIIQRTDKPFPPKFGYPNGQIYLAERFENQFKSLENIQSSIYILEEENFKPFTNHSAGDSIELRAEGPQKVKSEIKITNVLEYLKEQGAIFYSYADRKKAGIPESDKYFIKGILTTYLWKIEGRKENDFKRGAKFIKQTIASFPKYQELLENLVELVNRLPEDYAINFVNNIYDYQKDDLNKKAIQEATAYLKKSNSFSPEKASTHIK